MAKKSIQKVVLIGAGNVAHHLGLQFIKQGVAVTQVFSRTKRKAQRLAKLLSTESCTQLSEIKSDADLYIIAISDHAIATVAEKLADHLDAEQALIVHTSGATPSTIFKNHFKHYGVFYPLQSFSKEKKVNFENIPFCIDAKYKGDLKQLNQLASLLSKKIFTISDQQRATLHVAAVFVNNFTNLMYRAAEEILEPQGLSFDILRPLLLETALKVQHHPPKDMQTGPAIRGDENTVNRHLSYLKKEHPEYYPIYLQLTKQLFPEFKP